ncbi:hypothetical protein H7097_01720 [Aeromicrobium sp.]|nr:hypothetical protein [Candidatus Saccharibacteria bacterium]
MKQELDHRLGQKHEIRGKVGEFLIRPLLLMPNKDFDPTLARTVSDTIGHVARCVNAQVREMRTLDIEPGQ